MKYIRKNLSKAGAPEKLSRMARVILVDYITSFPGVNEDGYLTGPIAVKYGGVADLYVSPGSREYSMEASGEKDARAFKLKFTGSHPGTDFVALEYIRKNTHRDFIIILPSCDGSPAKVLGRPCAPLSLKASHKGNKDGAKFELTFEQELATENTYAFYSFPLPKLGAFVGGATLPSNETVLLEPINPLQNGSLTDGDMGGFSDGDGFLLVGTSADPSDGVELSYEGNPLEVSTMFALDSVDKPWYSTDGSAIAFRVYNERFYEIYRIQK